MTKIEPVILHIETTTQICSVALSQGEKLLALREENQGYSHAEKLMPFIDELLSECCYAIHDISAVSLSSGPGSYTGLRIGAATAKGLCYARNIPLISVPTVESIVNRVKTKYQDENLLFCPMIDARRMEVYTAILSQNNEYIMPLQTIIIDEKSFAEILNNKKIVFCGDGAIKTKPFLEKNKNAIFDFTPLSAKNSIIHVCEKYKNQQFENIAYFDPLYFKEYIPGKPNVKGLH